MPFGRPQARTREYAAIIRRACSRARRRSSITASITTSPYTGAGLDRPRPAAAAALGQGDPSLKIYTAPISPSGLRTAGEVADGALPYFMSPYKPNVIIGPILEGRAKAGRPRNFFDFDLAPYVRVAVGDDLAACPHDKSRPGLVLYIGGMGARGKNFYNDLTARLGYEAAAAAIQEHFLAGRRSEAAAAVPDALIDEISLVGPPARIKDRLQAWQELAEDNWVGSLVLAGADVAAMRVVAEAVL